VGFNGAESQRSVRANVDEDLAQDKEDKHGFVFFFVEVVEGAVFAEGVAECEENTAEGVKPEKSKTLV
jgi:hypothetical protein